jgi:hypothetical protein
MLPVKLNTSKICFLVAVMIVSVSITEPGLAAEHQPLPGQSTSGERWLFVQQNIRKVMNMPEVLLASRSEAAQIQYSPTIWEMKLH